MNRRWILFTIAICNVYFYSTLFWFNVPILWDLRLSSQHPLTQSIQDGRVKYMFLCFNKFQMISFFFIGMFLFVIRVRPRNIKSKTLMTRSISIGDNMNEEQLVHNIETTTPISFKAGKHITKCASWFKNYFQKDQAHYNVDNAEIFASNEFESSFVKEGYISTLYYFIIFCLHINFY